MKFIVLSQDDNVLGTIAKVVQTKGFSRKKKKEKKEGKIGRKGYKLVDIVTIDPVKDLGKPVLKKPINIEKSKIGAEGILPVTKIEDDEIWSERKVAEEVQRALLPKETTEIIKSDIAPKFLQTAQVTVEHVKRWIPRGVRAIRGEDPGYRKSGRLYPDGQEKKWALPVNFFLVSTNTIEGEGFMTSDPDTRKYGIDVAISIFENIKQYGRRTLQELMEDLGAWQPELISLVANGMINDHYLKIVKEKIIDPYTGKSVKNMETGKVQYLETMELVEENERLERLKKYSKQLEYKHKDKDKKDKKNGNRRNTRT